MVCALPAETFGLTDADDVPIVVKINENKINTYKEMRKINSCPSI
jgi:hypothetical protein